MDDPRWLRLITVGLVLAALAVGYFLLTGKFTSKNIPTAETKVTQPIPSPQPTLIPLVSPSPQVMGENTTNRGNMVTLPRTGSPLVLLGVIALGVMISGLSLRKFPD